MTRWASARGDTRVSDFGSNPNSGFPYGLFLGDYFSIKATTDDVYMVWADTRLGEYGAPNQKIGFARRTAIPQPTLFLSPPSGPGGQQVTLQGSGFQPDLNVYVLLGDSTIAQARTDLNGGFTNTLYMPVTSQGPQDLTVVDASGNRATTSYFTEFGFGDIKDQYDALAKQLQQLQDQLGGAGVSGSSGTQQPAMSGSPFPGMNRAARMAGRAGYVTRLVVAALMATLALAPVAVAQSPTPPPSGPASGSSGSSPAPGGTSAQQTGPAADTIRFKSFFVDRAPLDLQAGNMDMYLYGLRTEADQQLRDVSSVQLVHAPATQLSLILNPAPAPAGQLNPFSIPAVRQAMQYLVDRDFIAGDIYRGLAQPMLTPAGPSDFDFLTVYDIDRGSGIHYDLDYAKQLITTAMTGAGAELVNGVWSYGGTPIQIRFIARVEDERKEIGDLVRAALEKVGFSVAMNYQNFAPAIQTVYSTDPAAFQWSIYTEGWSRGSAQRYDSANINAMTAPWLGNMPGWRETGFWQYEDPAIDKLGQELFKGQFDSLEQRDDLYRQMTTQEPRRLGAHLAGQRGHHLCLGQRRRRCHPRCGGRPALAADVALGARSRS